MTQARVAFISRTAAARQKFAAAASGALTDTFQDVKAEAQSEAHFGKFDTYQKTRRSIDVDQQDTESGPQATVFTQSGHGAYLELGTSKMAKQPFLWAAFQKVIGNFFGHLRTRLIG